MKTKVVNQGFFAAVLMAMLFMFGCQPIDSSDNRNTIAKEALKEAKTTEVEKQVPANPQTSSDLSQNDLQAQDEVQCAQLSQQDCLNSPVCILDKAAQKGYFCRVAQDECEVGFIQAGVNGQKQCLNKGKCHYRGASCFCPEGKTCICGGGKPAMCAKQFPSEQPLR